MGRKKLIVCLVIGVFILFNYHRIFNWCEIKKEQTWLGMNMQLSDIEKLIEENTDNTDYKEYIEVSFRKEEGTYDVKYDKNTNVNSMSSFSNKATLNGRVWYDVEIKNISNKEIKIAYMIYPMKELRDMDSSVSSWTRFSNWRPSIIMANIPENVIQVGESFTHGYNLNFNRTYGDKLTLAEIDRRIKKDKETIEEYDDVAYLQVFIDDKEFYIKLEATE